MSGVDAGWKVHVICVAPEQDSVTVPTKPVVGLRVAVSGVLAPAARVTEELLRDPLKVATINGKVKFCEVVPYVAVTVNTCWPIDALDGTLTERLTFCGVTLAGTLPPLQTPPASKAQEMVKSPLSAGFTEAVMGIITSAPGIPH